MPVWDDSFIRRQVERSISSPQYSVLLEETTRNERELEVSRLGGKSVLAMSSAERTASHGEGLSNVWRSLTRLFLVVKDDPIAPAWPPTSNSDRRSTRALLSPIQMERRRELDAITPRGKAVIVGATGYFGRFLVEECRNKQMDVVVVARDVAKAQKMFDPVFDGSVERRRRESMGYVVRPKVSNSPSTSSVDARRTPEPTITYMHADLLEHDHEPALRQAFHKASLVFYLATARNSPLMSPNQLRAVDHDGLRTCIKESARADAHLVVINPLFAWRRRWGPQYLYQNYLGSKRGYLRVAREREDLLLTRDGSLSATLSELDAGHLRFSLFRTNHLVFPSFQSFHVMSRNDNVVDERTFIDIRNLGTGDLCARTFASLLMRAVCFHKSSLSGRVDVAGSAGRAKFGKVPIESIPDIDAALQSFR
jgi:hypothetical protein